MSFPRIGFVGAGNMAQALARGVLARGLVGRDHVRLSDSDGATLERATRELGVNAASNNAELASWAELLVVAVKPPVVPTVLHECGPLLRPSSVVLSIAAGVRISTLEGALPPGTRVIRAMPNVAASCGAGASALCRGGHASDHDARLCEQLLRAVGSCCTVSEHHMNAVTALSGSGPAYVLTFIEALADGGVREGLPRAVALELATQTVLGTAQMLANGTEHPAVWRDRVTSPGGTTAAGLAALEKGAFRHAAIDAVHEATRRGRELGGD
jgi:pyrroline-5-carboxylate reductase